MNKVFIRVVLLLFLLCPASEAKLLDAETFTLKNGLQVVVVPNRKAPIIKQMLWYKAGSTDELAGKGGIAHLLEHLMFRGTVKVPGSSFNDIVAQNGGDANAFTSHDFTAYHEFVDISRLEVIMALEADRMANLQIDDNAFDKERKIVFQERQQRVTNSPTARFAEVLERTLWQDYPYARPVTGTEAEIMNLSKSDAEAFYQRHYTPDNAVLVLAGDIDYHTAYRLSKKYFGKIKKQRGMPTAKPIFSRWSEKNVYRVETTMPEIKSPRVVRKYVVPSLTENEKTAYALMLFSKYLGEGDNSYMSKKLVLTGKATAATSSYNAVSRGVGTFSLNILPDASISVQQAENIIGSVASDALNALTDDILQTEKQKLTAGLVYIRDNPEDAAMFAGQMVAADIELDKIEAYEDNVNAVTLNDVKNAVSAMLADSTNITGLLLPEKNVNKEGK